MGSFQDLTGQKFGRLSVIAIHHKQQTYSKDGNKNGNRYYYLCLCDCGNEVVVLGENLKRGLTKSCGCFQKECATKSKTIHGHNKERIYNVWAEMKRRCYNKNDISYKNYGGRGITVCNEWLHDVKSFYDWSMDNGYRDDLTIDRIDNDKGYSPDNCRWVTMKVQQNNRRNNRLITYNGETLTATQWADKLGINVFTLLTRLKRGWSVERAFNNPTRKRRI